MNHSNRYFRLAVKLVASLAFIFVGTEVLAQPKVEVETRVAYESGRGTIGVKHGADGTIYVLNKFDKCIWVFDSTGKPRKRISSYGMGPSDLLEPRDFALDRAGNVIVADVPDVVKVFNYDGVLVGSFNFRRPLSVGALSDGSILVSGFPTESLISVFTPQGALVRTIGKPIQADSDPPMNAFLNSGTMVVDENDNIYYVFRYLLTPTVHKYSREGELIGEWRLHDGGLLKEVVKKAREKYHETKRERQKYGNPRRGAVGGNWVLSCAAFDSDTGNLWVAVGNQLLALDEGGRMIGRVALVRARGEWVQPYQMAFFGNKARLATIFDGVFEVSKLQLQSLERSAK